MGRQVRWIMEGSGIRGYHLLSALHMEFVHTASPLHSMPSVIIEYVLPLLFFCQNHQVKYILASLCTHT
jgi:hypothetical protein